MMIDSWGSVISRAMGIAALNPSYVLPIHLA
jgi:hypothetical protein